MKNLGPLTWKMLAKDTGAQWRFTTTLGTELRTGILTPEPKNEITTRTLIGTMKDKLENRKYRTNLHGLGMKFASLTRNGTKP